MEILKPAISFLLVLQGHTGTRHEWNITAFSAHVLQKVFIKSSSFKIWVYLGDSHTHMHFQITSLIWELCELCGDAYTLEDEIVQLLKDSQSSDRTKNLEKFGVFFRISHLDGID